MPLGAESGGKFSMTIPAVAGAAIGDLVTFKAAQGHTYVVGNSSHVRTEGLTIRAAGWMAIYEVDGAGGNVFSDITIAPGGWLGGGRGRMRAHAQNSASCFEMLSRIDPKSHRFSACRKTFF